MRRLELAVVFVSVLAVVATAAASADFRVDDGPCPEPPGGGPILRCPTAHVGQPYTLQLEAEDGCAPYNWFEVLNSALPGGLTMTRDGLISGIPTGAGIEEDFWIGEHDLTASEGGPSWCNFDDQSQKEFSIRVDPGLAIKTGSVGPGTVGEPYSVAFAARRLDSLAPLGGPTVQATWTVQSGSLPAGVTLTSAGVLAGTPTADGTFQFTVRAQYTDQSAAAPFTLVVRQPLVVRSPFASSGPPRAEVGIAFTSAPAATGGDGKYTWSIGSGSLPAGISLDASNGVISGSPRTAGRFGFGLTAADGEGRVATVEATFTVARRLGILTARLKGAERGHPYTQRLAAAGGVRPVEWTVLRGKLPPGLRLAPSRGAFVGAPRRDGRFRVTVRAHDALGATSRRTLVLSVKK